MPARPAPPSYARRGAYEAPKVARLHPWRDRRDNRCKQGAGGIDGDDGAAGAERGVAQGAGREAPGDRHDRGGSRSEGGTGRHVAAEMATWPPSFYEGDHMRKSAPAPVSTPATGFRQARRCPSSVFRPRELVEISVASSHGFCCNLVVSSCRLKGGWDSALAGRYMRWEILLILLTERGLTAMRNRTTLLRAEQSRAEQSRAEQSRAEQSRAEANCALFAPCGALETAYNIRDG